MGTNEKGFDREGFDAFRNHPSVGRAISRAFELMDERYGERGSPETVDEMLMLLGEAFAEQPNALDVLDEFSPCPRCREEHSGGGCVCEPPPGP